MQKVPLSVSVADAINNIKAFLATKDFEIFADIDHRANASSVDLDMPAARVLLFGNPMGGTKLMQKDIFMSFDLPIRIAVVESEGQTYLVHHNKADYSAHYQVAGHPVLDKMEGLFAALAANASGD